MGDLYLRVLSENVSTVSSIWETKVRKRRKGRRNRERKRRGRRRKKKDE